MVWETPIKASFSSLNIVHCELWIKCLTICRFDPSQQWFEYHINILQTIEFKNEKYFNLLLEFEDLIGRKAI